MLPWDDRWANAISGIESGGNYNASTDAGKGRTALGKYQVLDSNVGPWTRSILGRAMSPDEFLNDPSAQEAVFKGQFGNYVNKYGTPEDAASAWFTGRPIAAAGNVSDRLGTTANAYVAKFNNAMGATGVKAINNASQGAPVAATPPPDDGFLGQLQAFAAGKPTANGAQPYDIGDAMAGAGASMMALDNAKGAAVLAAMQQANRKNPNKVNEWTADSKNGTFYRTRPDGALEFMKNPNAVEDKPKMNESVLKHLDEQMEKYDYLSQSASQANDIIKLIDDGKLDLGMYKNWINSGKNIAGMSDEQSRAYGQYNRFTQNLVNDNLRLNKGVQTEGDAYRELKAIGSNGASYDNQSAREALQRVVDKSEQAVTTRGVGSISQHQKVFGEDQLSGYGDIANGWKDNFANIRKGQSAAAASSDGKRPSLNSLIPLNQ